MKIGRFPGPSSKITILSLLSIWMSVLCFAPRAMADPAAPPALPAAATYANGILTVNGVRYEMAAIPAGSFIMGSDAAGNPADEKPAHRIQITRTFWLGKTEVTQGLWKAVMGRNPSYQPSGDKYPVEMLSYFDCQRFVSRVNELTGKTVFRMPSEAEWEYAGRAGTTGERYGELNAIAWHEGNSGNSTHPVAQKQPNAWGLYDMLGNVYEWCADWYGPAYYAQSPEVDPPGPATGRQRILRGGCSLFGAEYARAAHRQFETPEHINQTMGFRLAAGSGEFGTCQVLPHIASSADWETILTIVNGDSAAHQYWLRAFNAAGQPLLAGGAALEKTVAIPINGSMRAPVRNLFPSAPVNSIQKIEVVADADVSGRLAVGVTYATMEGDQESSSLFTPRPAFHRLQADHLALVPPWYTGICVVNTGPLPVDLYFHIQLPGPASLKRTFKVADDLRPGEKYIRLLDQVCQTAWPDISLKDISTGTFSAWAAGSSQDGEQNPSGTPVDAINGNVVYGQLASAQVPAHGLSEQYLMRGEQVAGLNNYAREFWIPLNVLAEIKARNPEFNLTTPNYNGISYRNLGNSPQRLLITQYTTLGAMAGQAEMDIAAGERIARFPGDLGLLPQLGGSLHLESNGPGSALYLCGDDPDAGGMSVVTGGDTPGPDGRGTFFRVPAVHLRSGEERRSVLLTIINSRDTEARLNIQVFDEQGGYLPPDIDLSAVSIEARGTLHLDAARIRGEGFAGTLAVRSDQPVLVLTNEYTVSASKARTNASGMVISPLTE